ncbi:hypothetical protein AAE478_001085 [Parahypoxylon ruwenzoriense]
MSSQPVSDHASFFADRTTDTSREGAGETNHDDYYTERLNSYSPQHIASNSSSTQPSSATAEPAHVDLGAGSVHHVTHDARNDLTYGSYVPSTYYSATTNGMANTGDFYTQYPLRHHVGYVVNHDYSVTRRPELTTQAIATLDLNNMTYQAYDGNVHAWLPGVGYPGEACTTAAAANWSTAQLPGNSRSHSIATTSSLSNAPSAHSNYDRVSDGVRKTGTQFDASADNNIIVRNISDEDVSDP